jgi:hypothetical protein
VAGKTTCVGGVGAGVFEVVGDRMLGSGWGLESEHNYGIRDSARTPP